MDTIDSTIASFAHEINHRVPEGNGFLTIRTYRDETYICGDKPGLLTFAVAMLLQVTEGESGYRPVISRTYRMLSGHALTYLGVALVEDRTEIEDLKREQREGFGLHWAVLLAVLISVLALSAVGI